MKHLLSFIIIIAIFESFSTRPTSSGGYYILIDEKGHLFLECTINEKKALFLVDTGFTLSIIDINQIEKYELIVKLKLGNAVVSGLGLGTVQNINYVSYVKLISGRLFRQLFYGADLNNLNKSFAKKEIKICGILGGEFLKQYRAIINYDGGSINFLQI